MVMKIPVVLHSDVKILRLITKTTRWNCDTCGNDIYRKEVETCLNVPVFKCIFVRKGWQSNRRRVMLSYICCPRSATFNITALFLFLSFFFVANNYCGGPVYLYIRLHALFGRKIHSIDIKWTYKVWASSIFSASFARTTPLHTKFLKYAFRLSDLEYPTLMPRNHEILGLGVLRSLKEPSEQMLGGCIFVSVAGFVLKVEPTLTVTRKSLWKQIFMEWKSFSTP